MALGSDDAGNKKIGSQTLMTLALIIALFPVWAALAGITFVLTIGRKIARKERKLRLEAEQARREPQQKAAEGELRAHAG